MRNLSQTLISGANAASNQTSDAVVAAQLYAVSFQAVFSSSGLTGSIALEASNDPGNTTPSNWTSITSVSVTAGGKVMLPKTEICYQFIRAVWTRTAGTGTVTVNINAQGV